MQVYEKLPNDLKIIVDMYLHQLKFREIVLSIIYMSHCYNCDKHIIKQSDIFTNKYKNELGMIKWKFKIPFTCLYNFYV